MVIRSMEGGLTKDKEHHLGKVKRTRWVRIQSKFNYLSVLMKCLIEEQFHNEIFVDSSSLFEVFLDFTPYDDFVSDSRPIRF